MFEYLKNKRVMITGAGTLAHSLAEHMENVEFAVYSRNEASQFKFQEKYPKSKIYMGDVQDYERLTLVTRDFKPSVIIHTAAAKRVDVAQLEPVNTIKQNIIGTLNIGGVAIRNCVEAVIGIGTDKEVEPQTIYGWTKALGSASLLDYNRLGDTKFSIVRYGNILCSRSSVGVIWLNAARNGQKLKVTDPTMTRFFFPVKDGVGLINYGLNKTLNTPIGHGKIYSTEMCAGTLEDLAKAIDKQYNCGVEVVGLRVSEEKKHECLIGKSEIQDTVRTNDKVDAWYAPYGVNLHYFVTSPGNGKSNIERPFTSDIAPKLDIDQLWNLVDYCDKNTFKD